MLAPSLQGFDDVALNARVLQEHPGFIDEEGFENRGDLAVRDDRIRTMQNVKEQRLQKFRVLAHALEVEALEAREGNRVLDIVEEKSELAAASPLREAARNIVPERVRQHAQRAQRGVHCIQVFNLMKEFALSGRVEVAWSLALGQHFHEEREEVEIFLCRRQRKRVDFEIRGFQADADIRAAKKLGKTFEAPAQIEDERIRGVFLEVSDQEIQQETFPSSRSSENYGVGHIAVMEVQEVGCVMVGLQDRRDIPAGVGGCKARHSEG